MYVPQYTINNSRLYERRSVLRNYTEKWYKLMNDILIFVFIHTNKKRSQMMFIIINNILVCNQLSYIIIVSWKENQPRHGVQYIVVLRKPINH